jgi:hypothetical protein
VRALGGVILASIVSIAGVLVGAWWAPFVAGLAIGFVQPRARFAVPVGAIVGLLSWALPLAALQFRYGAGSAAESLAAIMGFGHQGAIPVVLTCVVGLLLGLTGAWLGSALSFPLSPQGRGSGRGA